ncbi:hypothetical protein [Saccharothrix australiensis]|uniref:Uncharacterized protein n=1 Tax=Saccharothrix australiensis TaxID=2072 RepID=A0A495W1I8_9PSEU|nr:hypothetical protein [Saccharothrix australiensis]RKT54575.1 hypothetical protein C8E97_3219 [Saccharothrix australiensis]
MLNLLPKIGVEIPCSCLALNTPMTIGTGLFTLDFKGGIKVRIEVNPQEPLNSVRLRVVGHKISAELPADDLAGSRPTTVTIEQQDIDIDTKSVLRLVSKFPPKFEQLMVLSFTMTIDNPEAVLRNAGVQVTTPSEPLVLSTKNPVQLSSKLTKFPPKGDMYKLENPMELVLPDNPDTTIVKIDKFPVKVGGL